MQVAIIGTFYKTPVYKKGKTLIKIKDGYLSVSNKFLVERPVDNSRENIKLKTDKK